MNFTNANATSSESGVAEHTSHVHSSIGPRLLDEAGRAKDRVLLASPFLSAGIAKQLSKLASQSTARWTLLTHLDATRIAGGYLSASGLHMLIEAGVQIRHLPSIHAKVYLVDDLFGSVGSGNLTGTGLGFAQRPNVELSIELDAASRKTTGAIVSEWLTGSTPIVAADVRRAEAEARRLPLHRPAPFEGSGTAVDEDELARLQFEARTRGLWIKSEDGEPARDGWRTPSWFSNPTKAEPQFKVGDLVIISAKAREAGYAVVEVTSTARFDPDFVEANGSSNEHANRWPWVNSTKPRLVPTLDRQIPLREMGKSNMSMENGYCKIGLAEFVLATQYLSAL